ncbi:MAG: hypothetical protein A2Y67_04325 [Candidatus Buchananbacteria bacterium RBG_13_39_9]|uniref:Radical SAM core domain-containing protein n=1 Tax=Candidatus Buchananbacteria bacterium RBG_13_39_9 TaxID=1797531 RepID=A0A1G1XNB8_9BACT|nr:MAG: hypothetical protein A2Y67_04325 [Candidatus Buchananbacteria bacterium RBG_13_39_9]
MRILWIQPWGFADYSQIDRFRKGYLKKLSLPRVMFEVLYFVAGLADFEILDFNLELLENSRKNAKQILQEKLQSKLFDAIFLTFPTVALGNIVGEVINWCKELSPQTPLVVGGEAVELMGEDIMNFWPIDYLYHGYGQEMPELLKQIACPEKFQEIAGLYRRQGNHIIAPKIKRGKTKLLDNYSPQDLYTLKGQFNFQDYLERYKKIGIQPSAFLEMMRGCSHHCTFCAINKSQTVLFRQPETVATEAEFLLQHDIHDFYLIDPTLGLNKKLTDSLLDSLTEIKSRNAKLSILGVTRTNLVTDSFAQRLKQAGFGSIGLGIETMTDCQLSKIQKKVVPEQSKESVLILHRQGIRPKLFLIHFPDIFSMETIKFLLELAQEKVNFLVQSSFFRPLYQKGQFAQTPDFRRFDQRIDCRSLNLDTANSIVEWLLVNLAFPSTDVNSQQGDPELLKILEQTNLTGIKIPQQFKSLLLRLNKNKYYLYKPAEDCNYLKPNLWVGDDYNETELSGVTILDLSKGGE